MCINCAYNIGQGSQFKMKMVSKCMVPLKHRFRPGPSLLQVHKETVTIKTKVTKVTKNMMKLLQGRQAACQLFKPAQLCKLCT